MCPEGVYGTKKKTAPCFSHHHNGCHVRAPDGTSSCDAVNPNVIRICYCEQQKCGDFLCPLGAVPKPRGASIFCRNQTCEALECCQRPSARVHRLHPVDLKSGVVERDSNDEGKGRVICCDVALGGPVAELANGTCAGSIGSETPKRTYKQAVALCAENGLRLCGNGEELRSGMGAFLEKRGAVGNCSIPKTALAWTSQEVRDVCHIEGRLFVGGDLRFSAVPTSPKLCQEACQNETACEFYTFFHGGSMAGCHLKTNETIRTSLSTICTPGQSGNAYYCASGPKKCLAQRALFHNKLLLMVYDEVSGDSSLSLMERRTNKVKNATVQCFLDYCNQNDDRWASLCNKMDCTEARSSKKKAIQCVTAEANYSWRSDEWCRTTSELVTEVTSSPSRIQVFLDWANSDENRSRSVCGGVCERNNARRVALKWLQRSLDTPDDDRLEGPDPMKALQTIESFGKERVQLPGGVTGVFATSSALLAFNSITGAAVSWGNPSAGADLGEKNLSGTTDVLSTNAAFVALNRAEGTAQCWGHAAWGGDCSGINFTGVTNIYGTAGAFMAVNKESGQAQCWGNPTFGGRCRGLVIKAATKVVASGDTFITVLSGSTGGKGKTSATTSDVVHFVGRLSQNRAATGGCSEGMSDGFSDMYVTQQGAVLLLNKRTGTGKCCGLEPFGGNCRKLNFTGITDVYAGETSFVALGRENGVSLCWGTVADVVYTGKCPWSSRLVAKNVTGIHFAGSQAVMAIERGSSVPRCFGNPSKGGDCRKFNVTEGIQNLMSSEDGFISIQEDGGVQIAGETELSPEMRALVVPESVAEETKAKKECFWPPPGVSPKVMYRYCRHAIARGFRRDPRRESRAVGCHESYTDAVLKSLGAGTFGGGDGNQRDCGTSCLFDSVDPFRVTYVWRPALGCWEKVTSDTGQTFNLTCLGQLGHERMYAINRSSYFCLGDNPSSVNGSLPPTNCNGTTFLGFHCADGHSDECSTRFECDEGYPFGCYQCVNLPEQEASRSSNTSVVTGKGGGSRLLRLEAGAAEALQPGQPHLTKCWKGEDACLMPGDD
eukprot:TRINITY_DN27562_c0_g1_i1.p1 TRINITY_DN27562_c0_g1~~TRINITY_DN27562_c0_g1_i1.p1  ORF type:complete len:1058 (+),score=157.59 TRINITY_DN27562_c0_g1_i1:72-3245(+)